MYGICDDDYVRDTWDLNGLVDITPDNEQFSFHRSNTDYMIYYFLDRIQEQMNIYN